ncbi:MAG: LysR family transcriptional regulator [[Clostridium] symbiosum]
MNMDMNLKHLEYFITVARLGSINKAAQSLFISQPYLGKIIKELENAVGAVLFQRTRGGVSLTPDGEDFMIHAENIIREVEKMETFRSSCSDTGHSLVVSMTKYSHIMESFIEVVLKHKDNPSFIHRLQ